MVLVRADHRTLILIRGMIVIVSRCNMCLSYTLVTQPQSIVLLRLSPRLQDWIKPVGTAFVSFTPQLPEMERAVSIPHTLRHE